MVDLSIVIPARNEPWLGRTVADVLAHCHGKTEVIVVLDGAWPEQPLPQDKRLTVLYHPVSVGQREATNHGVNVSRARYVCKMDAHCAVADGFDAAVVQAGDLLGHDVTQVPRMYNLHVFDWVCAKCEHREYQGRPLEACPKCGHSTMRQEVVWKPRLTKMSDFARFDRDLHFQYWRAYAERVDDAQPYPETMSFLGACFVLRRKRYWELDGLDERHGSWGQMGTEIACKSWLSGGRLVVNRKTWFSHLFRTQQGFSFPYPMTSKQQDAARAYSRRLWAPGGWKRAVHTVEWLVERFAPVPDWEPTPTKGAVYYSDGRPDVRLLDVVKHQLTQGMKGREIIAVTLRPTTFGTKQMHYQAERGYLTMFEQILMGLEASTAEVVFLTEHDVLYHPSHFEFTPPKKDVFYYNEHTYKVDVATGQAVFYYTKQVSGLCAYRETLLSHYRQRVAYVKAHGFTQALGFEPGSKRTPIETRPAERWMSPVPNIDLRHGKNLTLTRWSPEAFRRESACEGWKEVDEIPGWGRTKGRMTEFLRELCP